MTDDAVRLCFELTEEERAQGGPRSETVWAVPVGGDTYRVENVPFYLYDVAWGDVVRAERKDGILTAGEVVHSPGHCVLRLFVTEEGPLAGDTAAAAQQFEALDVWGERSRRCLALNIRPDRQVQEVADLLIAGEDDGRWRVDEGSVTAAWRAVCPLRS